jgi:hypothetical protein
MELENGSTSTFWNADTSMVSEPLRSGYRRDNDEQTEKEISKVIRCREPTWLNDVEVFNERNA